MAHIVFNVFSAVSHYNSTFNVALLLKSRGHHITYISDSDEYREHVTLKGFSFYKYTYEKYLYQHPFRSLLDFALLLKKNKWLESYIASLNRAKAFERVALDETLFDKIVLEIKPDLVIFDGALYLNALIFKKHLIPCAIFQLYLCLDKEKYIPSLTSELLPGRTFWKGLCAEFSWQKYFLAQSIRRHINILLFFGAEATTMAKKISKKRQKPIEIDTRRNFYFSVSEIPEIYFSPVDLDFPRSNKTHRYNIGPVFSHQRKDLGYDFCYSIQIEGIRREAKASNRPLVYCSLGSRNIIQFKGCKSFLQKVIYAFNTINCELIMAVGENIDPSSFRSVTDNIHIFQTVPQNALLEICDAMITHGGIQSILECIEHEVPMIVYPLSKNWDQCGNSARIVYHGLGLRGQIKKETVKDIQEKTTRLLGSKQYKIQLKSIKYRIRQRFDSRKIIETLESLIIAEKTSDINNPDDKTNDGNKVDLLSQNITCL